MTMTPVTVKTEQKSAGVLAVEALQAHLDLALKDRDGTINSTLEQVRELRGEMQAVYGMLKDIKEALQHQPAQPSTAPAPSNGNTQYTTFHADTLVMTYDDNGQPAYKAKGGRFEKFGVRVWPEVLPRLGIDPTTLKPGPNPINLEVKAELEEKTDEHGQKKMNAKRIVGLAQ